MARLPRLTWAPTPFFHFIFARKGYSSPEKTTIAFYCQRKISGQYGNSEKAIYRLYGGLGQKGWRQLHPSLVAGLRYSVSKKPPLFVFETKIQGNGSHLSIKSISMQDTLFKNTSLLPIYFFETLDFPSKLGQNQPNNQQFDLEIKNSANHQEKESVLG